VKKIFVLFALIAALGFMGCDGKSISDADVIGIWKGSGEFSSMTLLISQHPGESLQGQYTFMYGSTSYSGAWKRDRNILLFSYTIEKATFSSGKLILNEYRSSSVIPPGSYELTKGGSTGGSSLKIKNESSFAINSVTWQGASFGTIAAGSNSTMTVDPGSGYIRFTLNSTAVRTQEPHVVEKNETIEVTFTDNTVIVVTSDGSTTTIGALGRQ
jgi:hypothetical protein